MLLEADVPVEEVLLSDFDRWHAVLNRHYLATSHTDDERFLRALRRAGGPDRWPYPAPFRREVTASWERIFSFETLGRSPCYWGPVEDAPVQAVFWELPRGRVRRVSFFTAR